MHFVVRPGVCIPEAMDAWVASTPLVESAKLWGVSTDQSYVQLMAELSALTSSLRYLTRC